MTLQRKRRRSRLIIITGILMSLIVGAAIFMLLRAGSYGTAGPQVQTASVVIAAREIPARTTITEEDVIIRSVPVDATNSQAFTTTADVINRVSAVAIPAGQLMTPNLLASTQAGGQYQLPQPGEYDPEGPPVRAAAVLVPDDRAVAGSIQPGQRVDVIATLPISATEPGEATDADAEAGTTVLAGPSTKVTLQNVTVLARSGEIYILHVDLEMAEQLAELQAAGGTFTLVLRPESDEERADTNGATLDELINEYGFPIPRFVDAGCEPARTEP